MAKLRFIKETEKEYSTEQKNIMKITTTIKRACKNKYRELSDEEKDI